MHTHTRAHARRAHIHTCVHTHTYTHTHQLCRPSLNDPRRMFVAKGPAGRTCMPTDETLREGVGERVGGGGGEKGRG